MCFESRIKGRICSKNEKMLKFHFWAQTTSTLRIILSSLSLPSTTWNSKRCFLETLMWSVRVRFLRSYLNLSGSFPTLFSLKRLRTFKKCFFVINAVQDSYACSETLKKRFKPRIHGTQTNCEFFSELKVCESCIFILAMWLIRLSRLI